MLFTLCAGVALAIVRDRTDLHPRPCSSRHAASPRRGSGSSPTSSFYRSSGCRGRLAAGHQLRDHVYDCRGLQRRLVARSPSAPSELASLAASLSAARYCLGARLRRCLADLWLYRGTRWVLHRSARDRLELAQADRQGLTPLPQGISACIVRVVTMMGLLAAVSGFATLSLPAAQMRRLREASAQSFDVGLGCRKLQGNPQQQSSRAEQRRQPWRSPSMNQPSRRNAGFDEAGSAACRAG